MFIFKLKNGVNSFSLDTAPFLNFNTHFYEGKLYFLSRSLKNWSNCGMIIMRVRRLIDLFSAVSLVVSGEYSLFSTCSNSFRINTVTCLSKALATDVALNALRSQLSLFPACLSEHYRYVLRMGCLNPAGYSIPAPLWQVRFRHFLKFHNYRFCTTSCLTVIS